MAFTVVTGLRRSGTSATMGALRACGVPICGFKYPSLIYMEDGSIKDGGYATLVDNRDEANSKGFWEITSINNNGLHKDMHGTYDGMVVKMPVYRLNDSEPEMINKIIYITRKIDSIMLSHLKWVEEVTEKNVMVHAKAYLELTKQGLEWIDSHDKETIYIKYGDLVNEPVRILSKLCDFIGIGSAEHGAKYIETKLNRSNGKFFMPKDLKREWRSLERELMKRVV